MFQRISSSLINLDQKIPHLLKFQQAGEYFRQHKSFLIYLLLLGLLAYAFDLFQFALHIDSEIDAYKYGPHKIWIKEGRWGVYFLNSWLLPNPVMPVMPTLIAVVGSVLGAFFLLQTLSSRRGVADYLAGPMAVISPVLYFAFYWYSLSYALGIAFALVGFGLYCLTRWRWYGMVMAIACFCFAIGVYQAVLLFVVVCFGLYAFNSVLEEQGLTVSQLYKRVAVFVVVLAIAYGIYHVIMVATLYYFGQAFHDIYLNNFVSFEWSLDYLREYGPRAIGIVLDYYTGDEAFYLYEMLSVRILFYFSLLVVLIRLWNVQTSLLLKFSAMIALLITLAAPALMLLMNSAYMPTRTLFYVVHVLAGLIFIAASLNSNVVRTIIAILMVVCCFHFIVVNQRYSFSSYLAWQADREFSVMLLERINHAAAQLPKTDKVPSKKKVVSSRRFPLEIIGVKEKYVESPVFIQKNVIGASFYTWAPHEIRRQVTLFAMMGYPDYWPAKRSQKRGVLARALTMPVWPDEGSVAVHDGVIVVKLGDYHPRQANSICAPEDTLPACDDLRRSIIE